MFNFFKKQKTGQEEILEYISTIEKAVFSKVRNKLKCQAFDDEEADVLAMVFVSKLFALDSPEAGEQLSGKMDNLIIDILKSETDQDILYGIILSLQSFYAIEKVNGEIDSGKTRRIEDAVILFKSTIDLPRKSQTFELMKQLSLDLSRRYLRPT